MGFVEALFWSIVASAVIGTVSIMALIRILEAMIKKKEDNHE